MKQNNRFDMPTQTGHWAEDNRLGRVFADELVQGMRASDAPMRLGRAMQAMIERGGFGGVEVGFCHRIAELAMR